MESLQMQFSYVEPWLITKVRVRGRPDLGEAVVRVHTDNPTEITRINQLPQKYRP